MRFGGQELAAAGGRFVGGAVVDGQVEWVVSEDLLKNPPSAVRLVSRLP